jgi:hypothetical protein
MGMFVTIEYAQCDGCGARLMAELPVAHAKYFPYYIDLERRTIVNSDPSADSWLGEPCLQAWENPIDQLIEINKEICAPSDRVIILNCIDFLYGHALLKLLNAQAYLEDFPDWGLIAIVPQFLRWLVPKGVAEIWTVDVPLDRGQKFNRYLDRWIKTELNRFDRVLMGNVYSHPHRFDICQFTGIDRHDFNAQEYSIAFIWREDRLWVDDLGARILSKLNLLNISLAWQNYRIVRLFNDLKKRLPDAKFSVIGLGNKTQFPDWIEDARVTTFDRDTELKLCQLYARSRLVIGIHGSNMLLPSAHAGMTIDLMPKERWGNMIQDILYQETDPRMAAFRYRYLPQDLDRSILIDSIVKMISEYCLFKSMFLPSG